MLWSFYVSDYSEDGIEVRVYSAASFLDPKEAEVKAKEVSTLMGGVKYVVEKLKG